MALNSLVCDLDGWPIPHRFGRNDLRLFLFPALVPGSCLSEPFPNKPLEVRVFSKEAILPLFGLL
jgi:hypothetical protein